MTLPTASACRVLVADDNRDAADSLAELLRLSLGCEVETAYDGGEAVALFKARPFDVVVLDLQMPVLGGLEAARAIRAAALPRRPLMAVMTGKGGVAGQLADIDDHFDHAFAKPVDVDRVLAIVGQQTANERPPALQRKRFDFAELFTVAAQQVVPIVVAKRMALSFDYQGPSVVLEDDAASLQRGLHRIAHSVVDLLDAGFVIFRADVEQVGADECHLVLTAAGTGSLASDERITEVLERLELVEEPASAVPATAGLTTSAAGTRRSRSRVARGVCPHNGGEIEFASSPTEGVLFRCELFRPTLAFANEIEMADAAGARAWLVDSDEVGSAWLLRRLQRLGWAMTRFDSCAEAIALLQNDARRVRQPALAIVLESPQNTQAAARQLQHLLGESSRFAFAVMAGSASLMSADALDMDVRIHPLSPGTLADFTRELAPGTGRSSGETVPGALTEANRPEVLVVDDNAVNRIVAQGLLEALGYKVMTAADGLDAIEQCKRYPPDAVLMDLDMPVLKGLEATRRIRELQRAGVIAPFSIVAATADVSLDTRHACIEAGMDGYLSKPLSIMLLREELKRVAVPHWQRR